MSDPAFDVCGTLPEGVTVLEASAGTGKTFTIAALAARYVAAGTPLDDLLLVTFGRMATSELRERVRDRLVTAEQGLARARQGVAPPGDDEILTLLADAGNDAGGDVLATRHQRLATAIADFDAATIATTHGFCSQILASLGVTGDVDDDTTFVEDPTDYVTEVVDDLYVRRFHWSREPPPFDRGEALRIGNVALANPDAPIEPAGAGADTPEGMRRRLALAVRDELERRKRRDRFLTYDDLLTRLAATLRDAERGADACARLRERYRVVLVDEFQDTDPVQWEILRRAFADGGTTLVLIGDPKQAIYAFRGADVYAYLHAAATAGTRATLGVNHRSDQPLLDAYDALLAGSTLGHTGIAYTTVRAADANQQARLAGAPCDTPLRVRVLHRPDGHVRTTEKGYVSKRSGEDHVAADLAADVVELLRAPAMIATGDDGATRRVTEGDIAVLVGTNKQAALVRDALEDVGVPAVIGGAGSVFATPVARQWLDLLEALERPSSPTRARAAALTVFLGWSAAEVATADERAWEDVHARLHSWAGVLRRRGVAALVELITHAEALPPRLLGRVDGERELTDLRHTGELLHAEATTGQLGVTALTAWLRQRVAEAATDTTSEERSRRLESDVDAVQVSTVHRSKGLEFGIVYHPFLWQPSYIPDDAIPVYHDPDADDARTIDVAMGGVAFAEHRRRHIAEERGEDLRLAYVALTRARHQAIVWWAGSWESRNSPLGRLLFARDDDGVVAAEGDAVPDDQVVADRFAELAGAAPGCVAVERSVVRDVEPWQAQRAATAELAVRDFDRRFDDGWQRTSYSRLAAPAHEPRVASEPDDAALDDELPIAGGAPTDAAADEARLRARSAPLAATPGGARVGTLVHAVLEHTDFTAADLDDELARHVAAQRALRYTDVGETATLVAGVRAAIETPLGPALDDLALRDVAPRDRVDELDFELPLAGGDTPAGGVTVAALAAALREHLPVADPLAGYPEALAELATDRDLRGYLAGSIDLLLRTRDDDGTPRFVVVDYKTNWLGVEGEELSAWHYRPAALAAAMVRAHYPLQALLYAVAAHRYLRWRLPGYEATRHLGGVAYLFLRGMSGPDTPRVGGQPCGVFTWQPPGALVATLSDVLDGGSGP